MSGILRLESLTKGNTLKQGDKTPLKYRLFDADGEKLNIAGKSAQVRLVYPDFLTIGYEKDGLTVAQDDTVTFTIDKVIPAKLYHVEIIVDDKFIFPSRADEAKFTIDNSSLGTETNIIEIVGVDTVVRKAVDLINKDPNLIIDEDKLVGDIISNTGIGSIEEYYQQFTDVIKELSEDKDYHSLPEIAGARGGFGTLGARLNNTAAQLAQKVDKGNVSVSDINKNLGKLDQTYMTDGFLQQMAGTTPINAVPADGSLTTGKYADGSVIPDKTSFVRVGKNLFDKEVITRNRNVNESGIVEDRVGYAVSDFIPIKPGMKYHTGSTHRFAFYDGNKVFISSDDRSPTLTAPSNARFMRINLANTASAINSFQVELGEVATAYEPYKIEMRQIKLIRENYDANSILINHLADKPSASILIQAGAIDYNTSTKSLDFSEGSYFITHQGTYFNATSLLSGQSIPFGEENHAMIYWNPATKNIEVTTAVSDGEYGLQRQLALMGFVAHAEPENALFNFEYAVDGVRPNKVKNSQWYKKKINLLGDSITFGGTWVNPLAKLTGATLTNYGVNGSAIQKRTSRSDSFNERYTAMRDDADLIVVWGGVNDHHWSEPTNSFGEPDSTDITTFYGAVNSLITGLIAKYPTKKLAFITPMKNWGYTGAPNWNDVNSKGKTLTDYRDAIIERCQYYSVPILDLFNDSNIAPITSQHKTAFMPDGLHPNDEGGKRIATMILDFINGL